MTDHQVPPRERDHGEPVDQAGMAPDPQQGPQAPIHQAILAMQRRAGALLWDAAMQEAAAEAEYAGRLSFTERYVEAMGEASELRRDLAEQVAARQRAEEELAVAIAALERAGVGLQPLADTEPEGDPPAGD